MMPSTPLDARGLSPVMTVKDVADSLRFYKALGFKVDEEMKDGDKLQGAMLSAGAAHIGISQDDFSKGRDRVKGVGMRIYVETTQDIKALGEQAKAAGITLDQGPAPLQWGPMAFTATDPDGFKITVMNPD